MTNLLSPAAVERIAKELQTKCPSVTIVFCRKEEANCYWLRDYDSALHGSPENTGRTYWDTVATFLLLILAAEGEL